MKFIHEHEHKKFIIKINRYLILPDALIFPVELGVFRILSVFSLEAATTERSFSFCWLSSSPTEVEARLSRLLFRFL